MTLVDDHQTAIAARLARVQSATTELITVVDQANDKDSVAVWIELVPAIAATINSHQQHLGSSIADDLASLRSATSLAITDDDDDILGYSPSHREIRAAAGILLAELDRVLKVCAEAQLRPTSIEDPTLIGGYVPSDQAREHMKILALRLSQLEQIVDGPLLDQSKPQAGRTRTQIEMVDYIVTTLRNEIRILRINISTPRLIDIASVVRIVESILRISGRFYTSAASMVRSITSRVRDISDEILRRSRSVSSALRDAIAQLSKPSRGGGYSDDAEDQRHFLELSTAMRILSGAEPRDRWLELGKEADKDFDKLREPSTELMYLLSAASLPVIESRIWKSLVRHERYTLDTISAARLGKMNARRCIHSSRMEISDPLSSQRALVFTQENDTKISGSWWFVSLGYAVLVSRDENDDEVYNLAVALDRAKTVIGLISAKYIESAISELLKLEYVSDERKLAALALVYCSGFDPSALLRSFEHLNPSISPGFQIGMLNALSKRNPTINNDRRELLIREVRNSLSDLVELWISDDVMTGTVSEFQSAFDQEIGGSIY